MALLPNFLAKRPHVAEYDFTGLVVNANDTEFENGQAVYGVVGVGKLCYSHPFLQVSLI